MNTERWTLEKRFRFEAAHRLPKHDGKCARLHGHSWVLTVQVGAGSLTRSGPKSGMVVDYGDISKVVKPLVDAHLDHWFLNESTQLEDPTSERIAAWVFGRLREKLPGLEAVVVEETCTSKATYRGVWPWG